MKTLLLALFAVVLLSGLAFSEDKIDAASGATDKYSADKAELKKIVAGKKVLVVYFSMTGNTEQVAKDIAECFGADIEKVIDKKSRKGFLGYISAAKDARFKKLTEIDPVKLNPSKYDIVIIGSPVWAWAMTPAIRTYITRNKDKFKEAAFFITAGGIAAENIVPSMEELSGKKGIAYVGFNSKELKDSSKYWVKLTKFLESFKQK